MRKLFILLLGIVFYSCSENDRLIYSEGMHDIYYSDVTKDKDSIFVSLLTAERELTTTINVKLLGDTLRVSEKFKLEVIPGKTTAKEGVHYQKLPETYEFPTGVFEYKMPVTLIKGDEGITKAPVILALRLGSGCRFGYCLRESFRCAVDYIGYAPETGRRCVL